jgi:hypothetical protein
MFRNHYKLLFTLVALSSASTVQADLVITEVMPQTTAGTANTITATGGN